MERKKVLKKVTLLGFFVAGLIFVRRLTIISWLVFALIRRRSDKYSDFQLVIDYWQMRL